MAVLQSDPAAVPDEVLAAAGLRAELVRLEGRLAAMGLLERLPGTFDAATYEAWQHPGARATTLLRRLRSAGIGARMATTLLESGDPDDWRRGLPGLARIVEQSPHPAGEWRVLAEVLGLELLQRLAGVARSSVGRYRGGQRETPDDVAARLHHVALVVAELEGGYNAFGIRRWFDRRRAQLDGRAPADVLTGDWDPDDGGPRRVWELAAALNSSPAT